MHVNMENPGCSRHLQDEEIIDLLQNISPDEDTDYSEDDETYIPLLPNEQGECFCHSASFQLHFLCVFLIPILYFFISNYLIFLNDKILSFFSKVSCHLSHVNLEYI